jgi:hypothetical protein
MRVLVRTRVPQSGVRMTHYAEDVLRCSIFDGLVTVDQYSISIPFTKDLAYGDMIFPGRKVGVNIVGQSECVPARPMLVHGAEIPFCSSGIDAPIDKADTRAQRVGCACDIAPRADSGDREGQNGQSIGRQTNTTGGCKLRPWYSLIQKCNRTAGRRGNGVGGVLGDKGDNPVGHRKRWPISVAIRL